jgi:hypothetical protein
MKLPPGELPKFHILRSPKYVKDPRGATPKHSTPGKSNVRDLEFGVALKTSSLVNTLSSSMLRLPIWFSHQAKESTLFSKISEIFDIG